MEVSGNVATEGEGQLSKVLKLVERDGGRCTCKDVILERVKVSLEARGKEIWGS